MLIGSLVSPVQAKATALGALLPGEAAHDLFHADSGVCTSGVI